MILPTTPFAFVLLGLFVLLGWGLWANTLKLATGRRFEHYYFDFALGVLLTAVTATFTLGALGGEITTMDNITIVGNRDLVMAIAAGAALNLATMFLAATVSVAGLSVAFPVAGGTALAVGMLAGYVRRPQGNGALLLGGAAVVIISVFVCSYGYFLVRKSLQPGVPKAVRQASGRVIKEKPPSLWKGVILGLVSGLFITVSEPLVEMSRRGILDLQGYGLGLMMAAGLFFSTVFFNIWFMNIPVEGDSIGLMGYFGGGLRNHLLGLAGGVVWYAALLSSLLGVSAPPELASSSHIAFALSRSAPLLAALCGWLLWKETRDWQPQSRILSATAVGLFLVGVLLMTVGLQVGK